VVISSTEPASITLKSGGSKDKKDYEIMDNSVDGGLRVCVTLWGIPAKKFNFQPGTVVAFKGLRVTNFKGKTLNGGDYTGVYEASKLKLKEYQTLVNYYRSVSDNLDSIRSLTETEGFQKKTNNYNVRLIGEINENVETDLMNDPQTRYYVNAHVEMIRNDANMVYMACPSCKKKMNQEDSGYTAWKCERCDMTTTDPVPTYILSVKLVDTTGCLWTRVYGENAVPIMGNMTADKFKHFLELSDETREQEIKDQLKSVYFKSYSVLLKPSHNEYNGQTSLSYFASKVYDFSYKKNNDFLIQRIKSYTESEVKA
jgi:replication factor A1